MNKKSDGGIVMNKKKIGIVLFVFLGVMLCIMGFLFGKMSDSYRGTSITMGRMVNGEFVSNSASNATIGGNSEGVRKFKQYSQISYGVGGAFLLGAIVDMVTYQMAQKKPRKKGRGKIIEKKGNLVIVEFEDGKRKRLIIESGVIVAQGDSGEMKYQGDRLIGFEPRK